MKIDSAKAELKKISTVVITQDEEVMLLEAVKSCMGFSDEIVVVDGGSKDKTVEQAMALGCQVYVNQWPGYSKQRQYGIDKAAYDWIFLIDSDEVVSEELSKAIQGWKHRESEANDVFWVPRINSFLDTWMLGQVDKTVRVFNRKCARIKDVIVHETVDYGEAEPQKIAGPLWHFSFRDMDDQVYRLHKYSTLEAQHAYCVGRRFNLFRLIFKPVARFGQRYVYQRGFVQGVEGFMYAILWSIWDIVREMKLYELTRKDADYTLKKP